MKHIALAQAERLTVFQQSVRERFQEGGSIVSVFLVLGVIVLVLAVAYALSRRLEHKTGPGANLSSGALFKLVLTRMQLGRREKGLLLDAARSSRLENPATLLLSRSMFDRYVGTRGVQERDPSTEPPIKASPDDPARASTIAELRAYLFPPTAPSTPATASHTFGQ